MFLPKITVFQMLIVSFYMIYKYGIGGICLRLVVNFFAILCLIQILRTLFLNKSHLLCFNIFCFCSSMLYGKNNENQE